MKYGPEGHVPAGQKLDYRIEYENEGEGTAYGVYFTDTLDGNLDDSTLTVGPVYSTVDGSLIAPSGTYNSGTRTISWLVGEVGSKQGGYANITVNVKSDAPLRTKVVNYGTVYFPSVPEVTNTNPIVSIVGINHPPDKPNPVSPVDGERDTSNSTTLTWTGSDPDGDPVLYDVYFGPSGSPQLAQRDSTFNVYDPGVLDYGKSYEWKVVAKDPDGAITGGDVWHFTTNIPIHADFNASPLSGFAPLTVEFTDNSSGFGPFSYAWDFNGDGIWDSILQNPTYMYMNPGTFIVNLTINNAGASSSKEMAIEVSTPPPVADFIANTTSGPTPLPVQFTDHSTGFPPLTYAWDFNNDGVVDSTLQNPTHTFNEQGTYTVNLTVSNTGGNSSKEMSISVLSLSPPKADFTTNTTSGIAPLAVKFADNSTGIGPLSYAWDFNGDGIVDSTIQNPTYTYMTPGTYAANLTVTNAGGSSSKVMTISVHAPIEKPTASFSQNKYSGKIPLTVQFTDKSLKNPTKYLWRFGDGGTSEERNPRYTYERSGLYIVSLRVTNEAGSDTAWGIVLALPKWWFWG
jgi:uncharacterized repeat protein (TIGR01451 family)